MSKSIKDKLNKKKLIRLGWGDKKIGRKKQIRAIKEKELEDK